MKWCPALQPVGRAILIAVCALGFAGTAMAAPKDWFAEPRHRLALSIGSTEIFDPDKDLCWGVEYVPDWRFYHVAPWIFAGAGKNNEFYSAIGILLEINLPWNCVLVPSFGTGYYNARGGLDLGYDMQFRSSISLHKEFGNGHRLGVAFGHISNGSLSQINPGTEYLNLVYTLPLDIIVDFFRPSSGG